MIGDLILLRELIRQERAMEMEEDVGVLKWIWRWMVLATLIVGVVYLVKATLILGELVDKL